MTLRTLFILLISFVSMSTHASDLNVIKDRLFLEAVSYRLVSEISLYSIYEDEPQVFKRMNALLSSADQYASRVQNAMPDVAEKWQPLRQFIITSYDFNVRNQADYSARLEAQVASIMEGYAQNVVSAGNMHPQAYIEHSLLITLEQLLAAYFRLNNNVFGGHGGIAFDVDGHISTFEQQLKLLESQNLKAELERNWDYIKATLQAHNKRSAVYIVERMGDKMRNLLLQNLKR